MRVSDRAKANAGKSILFTVVIILCIVWIVPIYLLVLISFKSSSDYASSAVWSIPKSFTLFDNIKYVLIKTKLGKPFLNSLIYVISASSLAIFISSLAAYGIARLKIRGAFTIFIIIWSGMIFPIQIYLIPLYKAYLMLNLYNTKIGMIFIYTALATPFCVFVFRNYFLSLPTDFQEAAKIDGCSNFQIYLRMLMPNSIGPIAIMFLFQGSYIWNDLILGMVLSSSDNARPVMNSLVILTGVYAGFNVPAVMTGSLISTLPIIILYIALQRYLIEGLKIQVAGE